MPTQFDFGFLAGLLVGEGHFGGDGRQPQVTLRMHVRHEAIFDWLQRTFPGGRLYGPYHHGGRDYLQWMARGAFLRDELMPVLDRFLSPSLDRHSFDRYELMKARYPQLTSGPGAPALPPDRSRRTAAQRTGPQRTARNEATKTGPRHTTGDAADPDNAPDPGDFADPGNAADPGHAPDRGDFADLFAELREVWPT
jgi:hypothetical protein